MQDNKKTKYEFKENPVKNGIFLLLPFFLITAAIILIMVWAYFSYIKGNIFYRSLINENESTGASFVLPEAKPDEFPPIAYQDKWATLNVEGWVLKDIPVYFGDNTSILAKGAGHWIGSKFCGQHGKVVISGHVTTFFYEIEDCKIGTKIYMNTIYGDYVYEVKDIVIFDRWTEKYIERDDSKDSLVLYTCYPRLNGYDYKEKRIALLCDLVSGKEWPGYEE